MIVRVFYTGYWYVTLSLVSKSFVFFLFRLEQDLIGLTSSGQVVYHSALVDVEDELTLSRKMLKRLHRCKSIKYIDVT